MLLFAMKLLFTYLWLFALFRFGWAQDDSTISETKDVNVPTCGFILPHSEEKIPGKSGGTWNASIGIFPWHATLYVEKKSSRGTRKDFRCGATIIQNNLLMTAAQCVYDERTRTIMDPGNLFIVTGNIHRDYDSPLHDYQTIRKRRVKNVHMRCTYHGLVSNYGSDIALLELRKPFKFSRTLHPACLDVSGSTEQVLESGVEGRVVGFGKTATKRISKILQAKTVSYIPQAQCRNLNVTTPYKQNFISSDKFCGGYKNGTGVCLGDKGGGLVFKRDELWYVMGIVSLGIGIDTDNEERTCGIYSYTLYTKVSEHMPWIQEVIFDLGRNKSHPPCSRNLIPFLRTTNTPSAAVGPDYVRHRRATSDVVQSSCLAPPQPVNGEWKLDRFFCPGGVADCTISEGTALEPGSQLVYSCNTGYRVNGNTDVYCRGKGKWSRIPSCIEEKCVSLSSASTVVSCSRFGKWVNCDSPVLPATRAEVSCRQGYKKDTDFITTRRGVVNCNVNGKWEPEPIKCIPVCGVAITRQQPLVYGGVLAKIGDFPWHVSLFMQIDSSRGSKKAFLCGATIIQSNLVLTAAHCIYDETTKTTRDADTLLLITGNIFRDYDSPVHNPEIVRKARVKNVYASCNYYGLTGNYGSDIALLELQQPFEFSSILLPACLDDSGYSDQFLEPGVYGRVAGFGRTEAGASSSILQTITVPYISYSQCKTSNNADQNAVFISSDKFCAGYSNGSAVCEGDSGGGLVFKKGDLWYVMGIVSVGLGVDLDNGEKTCDKYSYSLYTKVSAYMTWIQDVLFYVERNQLYPSCSHHSKPSTITSTTPIKTSTVTSQFAITSDIKMRVTNWWDKLTTATPDVATSNNPVFSCLAPPQLSHGEWWLHKNFCEGNIDCKISQGTALTSGSQLVYKCSPGYKIEGSTDVYCRIQGTWTPLPTCIASDKSECECVPYYRCNDASLVADGSGIIDIRFVNESSCPGYLDVCCQRAEIRS